jgi:hypothetical protein
MPGQLVHHPLPLHHPLAVLPVPALRQVGLKNRCRRLLDLQEQRILRVASLEQTALRSSMLGCAIFCTAIRPTSHSEHDAAQLRAASIPAHG